MRINKNTVALTNEEAKVLNVILSELVCDTNNLRNMVGSNYVDTVAGMAFTLSHMEYTRKHGIKAEDMDEYDLEREFD